MLSDEIILAFDIGPFFFSRHFMSEAIFLCLASASSVRGLCPCFGVGLFLASRATFNSSDLIFIPSIAACFRPGKQYSAERVEPVISIKPHFRACLSPSLTCSTDMLAASMISLRPMDSSTLLTISVTASADISLLIFVVLFFMLSPE